MAAQDILGLLSEKYHSLTINLTRNDALVVIAGSALVCHLIFKRWEPTNIPVVISLLILAPLSLSALLTPHYGLQLSPVIAFGVYHLVLATSIVLYRLSPWHPLARYPGPLLAKISQWYIMWKSRNGKQHTWIQDLHNKYGDIVRIGPNNVSIRDAAAVTDMMGTSGLPKGPAYKAMALEPPIIGLIGQRDPVEHARRRRPWSRAFGTAALKEYEPIISKRVIQLSEALANQRGTLDLAKWFSYFTYDFMGDMVFGGGSEMLANGDNDGIWTMFKVAGEGMLIYHHVPWLAHYAKRLPISEEVKKMRRFALGRAAIRYKNGATTKDLFYYLSNEDGAEKAAPSPAQVISDGVLATIAASDTTSSVLSNIFWNILRRPEYYKRLQAEVDKFYPAGEDALDTVHHHKMHFLDALVNETLRVYPVLPSGSQRAPIPGKGDRVVGPYYIPDGTTSRVHFWSLQRDPRYFSHPETFWPERWLIAEGLEAAPPGETLVHNPNAFIPFSFGPSNCVGKNLAQLEMRMVVCYLMQNLDFALAEGWNPAERDSAIEDHFVVQFKCPVPVTVRKRT